MCVPGAVPGVESHVQMFLQTDHASSVRLSGTIIGIRTSRQVSTVHVLAELLRESGNQKCRHAAQSLPCSSVSVDML
jgi:hypothetical protein